MAPRTRRALFSVTLFLATCAVLGTFINEKVAAQSSTDESTLRDSLHQFTDVYNLVEQNYAEPLDQDKTDKAIYDGAIPGMLHVLDPHSNFYDPKAFAQMREEQHRQVLRRGHVHPAAVGQDRRHSRGRACPV